MSFSGNALILISESILFLMKIAKKTMNIH